MEKRRLGRTGHHSTIVTFGGAAIGGVTQEEADKAIDIAREHGVNHFDVAPSYGDAELRMAPWMPAHRATIFLGCKTTDRTRDTAKRSIHKSLERLGVDRFDLFQLHSVGDMETLDQATGSGGALEAVTEARDEGLFQYIGITGHGLQSPAVHAEALRRFDFDTVMFPLNFILYHMPDYRRDYETLIEMCRQRDVGVHILKTLAKAPWGDRKHTHDTWYEPFTDQPTIDKAVAWVAAQPVHTMCATGDVRVLPRMLEAAERVVSVPREEVRELAASASGYDHIFGEGSI